MKLNNLFVALLLILPFSYLKSQTPAFSQQVADGIYDWTMQSGFSNNSNPAKIVVDGDPTLGGSVLIQSDNGNQNQTGNITLNANGTAGSIFFKTANITKMTLSNNGNFGIGNASFTPLDYLHLRNYVNNSTPTSVGIRLQHYKISQGGNSNAHWLIKSYTPSDGYDRIEYLFGTSTTPTGTPTMNVKAYLNENGNFYVSNLYDINYPNYHISPGSSTSSIFVKGSITTQDGTVRIGNIPTLINGETYRLAVDGKIFAESLDIIADVPASDYVFEPGYKLKSLSEIESYVKENKHLPEVPSAKEFKENGYSVGKMDDLLLRKVEELTLHMIEQDKKIEKLEKENAELKNR